MTVTEIAERRRTEKKDCGVIKIVAGGRCTVVREGKKRGCGEGM